MNKYRLEEESPVNVLEIDNTEVRKSQIEKLNKLRADRDEAKAQTTLEALRNAAKGSDNLLAACVEVCDFKVIFFIALSQVCSSSLLTRGDFLSYGRSLWPT